MAITIKREICSVQVNLTRNLSFSCTIYDGFPKSENGSNFQFHHAYSLHPFYRQSGVYTTLDEKSQRWIVLSTAIAGTFLLAVVDAALSRLDLECTTLAKYITYESIEGLSTLSKVEEVYSPAHKLYEVGHILPLLA